MRPLLPLAGCLLLALAGCTTPSSDSGANTPAAGNGPAEGGSASQAPVTGTLRLGMMPKQKGIPYFNACEKGARKAAEELKDVELTFEGPTEDKSEAQSMMLDTWIVSKFNAIAVACNDPDQIAASLARARDKGIAAVTYDADADPLASKRQFFVNQAGVEAIAVALVDEMAAQAGKDAQVAVVSSSPTAPNQSAWLKAMEKYRAEKYPQMKVVVTEYAGENQATSQQKAESILKAYPAVKGIYGMTSVAFPGAAKAVGDAGKAGKVAVVGLGTPNDMKPYVDKGIVKAVILWSPVDLGYLTVEVARAVARGELKAGDTTFKSKLGEKQVQGDVVLLGKPMRFTKENIGQFDF